MARNKFKAAISHIKSTQVDEKIQRLDEAPTNSTSSVYDLSPRGQRYGKKDPEKTFYANADGSWPAGVPGTPGERKYVRPAGYWEEGPGATPSVQHDEIVELDFSYDTQIDNPRQTTTLIDETTGRVKTELPPNSRSFILGPLVDLYFHNHSNDNRTYVGYIQKDTREFVLLASVAGTWGNDNNGVPIRADGFEGSARVWNGQESGFTAHNPSFTFEMLQWHHDRLKEGKYVKNVAFFNSGGTPIISGAGGTGQPGGTTQGNVSGSPTGGDAGNNGNADQTHGSGGEPDIGSPQNPPQGGNDGDAGGPFPKPPPEDRPPPPPEEPRREELESLARSLYMSYQSQWESANQQAMAGDMSLVGIGPAELLGLLLTVVGAVGMTYQQASQQMGSIYTDAVNSLGIFGKGKDKPKPRRPRYGGYNPDGTPKIPLPGEPGYKDPNAPKQDRFPPRQGRPGRGMGDTWLGQSYQPSGKLLSEDRKRILREIKQPLAEISELKPEKLKKYRPNFKGRFTAQNTPDVTASKESDNMVRAKNAAGQTWRKSDRYWGGYESQERANVIYDHVGHGQIYWDEIVSHNQGKKGVRDREVQEELNKHYAVLAERKIMKELGLNEQETLNAPNDPLFKRVKNTLLPQIDYIDKPSPMGYPNEVPRQRPDGYPSNYGMRDNYYTKLDQTSADSMPETGNELIDRTVAAQKTPLLKRVSAIRKKKGKANS